MHHENEILSVLTLNCWGLYFSKAREARITAIGAHLADPVHNYDLVGLQEVWREEDYQRICNLTKGTLPYSKFWTSGIDGSGLAILSKFPILETSIRRFQLNGDPTGIFHGDWYDGKSCVSAVISHPQGDIVLLNTHLHATYDSNSTKDRYLGCRVSQAWEVASTIRSALHHNPLVIALGDFNSAPDSLVTKLIKNYAGLTDTWEQIHLASPPPRTGLSPQEGVDRLGITCDTPLNGWTSKSAAWPNHWTGSKIGERLDYIFYKASVHFCCNDVRVVLQDKVALPGSGKTPQNVSDHFAVHAQFSIRSSTPSHPHSTNGASPTSPTPQRSKKRDLDAQTIDDIEHAQFLLNQQLLKMRSKRKRAIWMWTLFFKLLIVLLWVVGYNQWLETWIDSPWSWILLSFGVAWCASLATMFYFYGFIHCSEAISSYTSFIEELKTVLDNSQVLHQ